MVLWRALPKLKGINDLGRFWRRTRCCGSGSSVRGGMRMEFSRFRGERGIANGRNLVGPRCQNVRPDFRTWRTGARAGVARADGGIEAPWRAEPEGGSAMCTFDPKR